MKLIDDLEATRNIAMMQDIGYRVKFLSDIILVNHQGSAKKILNYLSKNGFVVREQQGVVVKGDSEIIVKVYDPMSIDNNGLCGIELLKVYIYDAEIDLDGLCFFSTRKRCDFGNLSRLAFIYESDGFNVIN